MMVMFHRVSRRHPAPGPMFGLFMLGYFAVWTGFAFAALVADTGVHGLASRVALIARAAGPDRGQPS